MTINEKCAYLKGLAEGLKPDTDKAEGKLIAELIDFAVCAAKEIETLKEQYETLQEYVEELDCDLGEVEEYVYELDDDFDDCDCENCDCDDCEDCEYDCDCDNIEDGMRCAMCPNCGDAVCYEEDADPSTIVCPSCNTPLSAE